MLDIDKLVYKEIDIFIIDKRKEIKTIAQESVYNYLIAIFSSLPSINNYK